MRPSKHCIAGEARTRYSLVTLTLMCRSALEIYGDRSSAEGALLADHHRADSRAKGYRPFASAPGSGHNQAGPRMAGSCTSSNTPYLT